MTERERRRRRAELALGVLALALLSAGCSALRGPSERVPMEVLAVLPLEKAPSSGEDVESRDLPPEATEAVTARIYGVLADQAEFRFVPDLTVRAALDEPGMRDIEDLTSRATALGKQVGADGVIFGRVFRFRERVGTRYGATEPASVSFELALLQVATGKVVWQGRFDRTQQSLSSNLLDFWMFWRAGPHWFTARELAGLGVEQLFEEMARVAAP
jgi:PBP1b-binding outer membrane lipoprotein LpoB